MSITGSKLILCHVFKHSLFCCIKINSWQNLARSLKLDQKATLERGVTPGTEKIPERKQLCILWHTSGFLSLLPNTCLGKRCSSQDGKAEMKVVHTCGVFTEPGREDKGAVA
uniref:Uncharacterized protein n=1 Tax=Micrurus spixii TaxID=129469 RepID=A0A2D4M8I4_9SAUR